MSFVAPELAAPVEAFATALGIGRELLGAASSSRQSVVSVLV